jgi:hypothetical protein
LRSGFRGEQFTGDKRLPGGKKEGNQDFPLEARRVGEHLVLEVLVDLLAEVEQIALSLLRGLIPEWPRRAARLTPLIP